MIKIENFRKKTPRNHKILGRIATAISGASAGIVSLGLVDNKPMLKIALIGISIATGGQAVYHGNQFIK